MGDILKIFNSVFPDCEVFASAEDVLKARYPRAKKFYRHKLTDNIMAYSEEVTPKEIIPRKAGHRIQRRLTPSYDESLSRKLICRHCEREFIGRTSNGFAYHIDDDCGGTSEDLEFKGEVTE